MNTLCCIHDKDEAYQIRKIEVFQERSRTNRLYTTQEIGKDVCKNKKYLKIHLNDIFWKGFFECKRGLFLVSVAVSSNVADHSVVIDSNRGLLIDPSFEQPISFQVLYTDGKPDEQKWKDMFKQMGYKFFSTMHQLYSKHSRFCEQPANVAVGPADIVGLASDNANGVKHKKSRKRKKRRTTQQTEAVEKMEVVLGATAVKKKFFCNGLTCDILERIIGVQIR